MQQNEALALLQGCQPPGFRNLEIVIAAESKLGSFRMRVQAYQRR